jgi:excinuclease UvrABC nuclease subunit
MTPEERDKQNRDDLRHLTAQPQFVRFLWRVIQTARIFDRTADGSNGDCIASIARRNLGLEILEMVETGQPVPHPEGQPILTILQVLREEANQPAGKTHAKPKYDRTTELDDEPGED